MKTDICRNKHILGNIVLRSSMYRKNSYINHRIINEDDVLETSRKCNPSFFLIIKLSAKVRKSRYAEPHSINEYCV